MVIAASITEIFDNTFFFLTFVVTIFGIIGLFSRSFKFGAFTAFLAFGFLTIESQYVFYVNLMYVLLAIMLPLLAFQTWSLTTGDSI
ncbi:hypothetical protein [Methanohalobium sp.]|uniref:hypothetical protein n=1 Tax=Methanohalobium sp. TaxID=2837493 RepID=UPI0025E4AE46|nr:hypothetical protein [Methanohalobium sp.]